jgi:hypothetical protein
MKYINKDLSERRIECIKLILFMDRRGSGWDGESHWIGIEEKVGGFWKFLQEEV